MTPAISTLAKAPEAPSRQVAPRGHQWRLAAPRWTVGRRAVGGSQDLRAQLAGRLHLGIGRVAQSLAQVGVGRIELHAVGAVAGR
jgi:hypothetical protein